MLTAWSRVCARRFAVRLLATQLKFVVKRNAFSRIEGRIGIEKEGKKQLKVVRKALIFRGWLSIVKKKKVL
jgi:hypothetical protein